MPFRPYFHIYGSMKTTVDLPDDLFLKAKVLAAERRTSMKELMIQALRLITQPPPESGEKKRKATLKRLLKGMRASNTEPMAPLRREELHDR